MKIHWWRLVLLTLAYVGLSMLVVFFLYRAYGESVSIFAPLLAGLLGVPVGAMITLYSIEYK